MDITTILGILFGVGSVIAAMFFKGISFGVFQNPAAFTVIFGGTIASVLISFPGKNLKDIGKLFGKLFNNDKDLKTPEEVIDLVHSVAVEVRKNGIISMEAKLDTIGDSFLSKGLKLLCDGNTEEKIREIMESEISAMEERHATNASIFSSAGMYAPTLGVLGAVFGLIAAMGHIEEIEKMSESIAAAFIATILGIFTGYVLWNPFATKLKVKSKEEVSIKEMIIVGVSEMAKGTNPMIIKEALIALLPAKEQERVAAKK